MNSNDKRHQDDQEIDLSLLSDKLGSFFQGINTGIFKAIQFIIKNSIIIGLLFVVGVGMGMYLDKTQKIYDHEIIVQPNFGSTDYLYAKVELLQSKVKERDTVFLKGIGIADPSLLATIKIEPVVDIYKFISGRDKDSNEQNFELLKLMAEDGDMKTIVKEETTSKNYAFHLISFSTIKLTRKKDIIEPLLNYLNNSEYYNKIKDVYMENADIKIKRNNEIIAQIDGFLNSYTKADESNRSDKLVYYNENTQLNDVIQTKNNLISEIGRLQLDKVNTDKIVKASSTTMNIKNTKSLNGKLKLVLPILFIFLYMSLYLFISFYKTQAAKNK